MANNKNITFNQLEASMTKVKAAIDKKANTNHGTHVPTTGTANNATYLRNDNQWHKIVPSDIGAAPTSHGDHVTYSSTSPSAPGTASAGSAANVSRGDHVHPLQTNVSGSSGSCTGNAATATKLKTARNIALTGTITGNANFDGSGNISIATSVNNVPASGNWFKGIPTVTSAGVMEVGKYIDFHNAADGTTDYDVRLQCNGTSANTVNMPTSNGTLALLSDNVASATKLQAARKLTIGNTEKTFNGTADVSWSLSDIGAAASNHGHSNMLTFKSNHSSDWTSATSMAEKVYMGGWHGSISDSSKTKGYISLGLTRSSNSLDFMLDGDFYANENNLVLNTGNYKSHVTPASIGAANASHGTHVTYGGNGSATTVSRSDHTHSYIPLGGSASITGDLEFTNYSGTATRGVIGKIGDNDYWRIAGGSTANNAGYLEIATADDANEPIYVRQYGSGKFGTLTRTATLLDGSGNTSFPGTVTAPTFKGALNGNASTATKLQTTRNIGKASFNGTSDIYLSDIMGRADTSSTANQYKNQYTKFARIDVSDRTYNACVGKISFINTEANAAKGILEFYIRTQDTIANSDIELCWSSLTNKKYADSVSVVKVSDGVFDLYYQPKNDWNTAKFTIIDCHKPKKITLYSDQGYVSSITPVCTSSLNAQYVDNIYTDYVSGNSLALTTNKYQYASITSNTTINLPSVSSFTEIHLFFDWPSGVSITMPSNVKWQEGVMYGPGYTHEFVFTYINSDIGWLGGCVVYG